MTKQLHIDGIATLPKLSNIYLACIKVYLELGETEQAIADDFCVNLQQIVDIAAQLRADAQRKVAA